MAAVALINATLFKMSFVYRLNDGSKLLRLYSEIDLGLRAVKYIEGNSNTISV